MRPGAVMTRNLKLQDDVRYLVSNYVNTNGCIVDSVLIMSLSPDEWIVGLMLFALLYSIHNNFSTVTLTAQSGTFASIVNVIMHDALHYDE